jgi:hypothetical protein
MEILIQIEKDRIVILIQIKKDKNKNQANLTLISNMKFLDFGPFYFVFLLA